MGLTFAVDFCRIMIPPSYVGRLTDALQRKGFFSNHRWCRNTLSHKFYIPTPDFFKEENIPFELVIVAAVSFGET